MVSSSATDAMHRDAGGVGCGGTLNEDELRGGLYDNWCHKCILNWEDRAERIIYHELKDIRFLFIGSLRNEVSGKSYSNLLPQREKQDVMHITNELGY